jgi:hypothetical protein
MIKKSVLLTALAIAGFAVTSLAQTVPNYVPTNGLVGWWPFNGNANDESGNGNNGTINGPTLAADRFGNTGKAYSFDGINDYIKAYQVLNNYSVSLWFKPISLTNQFNNLFDYENSYAELTNDSTIYARAQKPTPPSIGVLTNYKNNLNTWHHLVVIYSPQNSQMDVYIDNVNHFTSTSAPGGIYWPADNNDTIYFGGYYLHNINYFNGIIDDIGTWNRALTQQEITDLYNANICYQTITVTDTLLINTNLTGFNPVTYQNTIKIWPNPTNDHITIDNGNLANLTGHQIKISNALGQQVFQSAITQQQFYVDMSTWGGTGIYFVNLINAQGVTIETRKIVLQ